MMTWLFISAIALGVVIAVTLASSESAIDETQAEETKRHAINRNPTINAEN